MSHWEQVGNWYNQLVGDEGHYYHRNVILPRLLELLQLDQSPNPHLLDIACGQGILARHLPPRVLYTGIDGSATLIENAKKMNKHPHHHFIVGDVTQQRSLPKGPFSHVVIVLALQNIEHPKDLIRALPPLLSNGGRLSIVCNHPCFRIPRQSSWGIDAERNIQYRRVDSYLSPMRIPIQMQPSQKHKSITTESFHHSLSSYVEWLTSTGFLIDGLHEWCSDRVSTGRCAKMENRARREIPLFLAMSAIYWKSTPKKL